MPSRLLLTTNQDIPNMSGVLDLRVGSIVEAGNQDTRTYGVILTILDAKGQPLLPAVARTCCLARNHSQAQERRVS